MGGPWGCCRTTKSRGRSRQFSKHGHMGRQAVKAAYDCLPSFISTVSARNGMHCYIASPITKTAHLNLCNISHLIFFG